MQHLVDSISTRLQLEVEIVDTRLQRVGASGPFRRLLGTRQERGFINRYVLETGKPVLISNPGREHLCTPCDLKDSCMYRAGLSCPIMHQGHVVGVFSLVGLTHGQRDLIHQGGQRLLEFIAQISSSLVNGPLLPGSNRISPACGALPEVLATPPATRRSGHTCGRTRSGLTLGPDDPFAEIIGASPALMNTIAKARRVAASNAVVLLAGETGAGKEMFARAIHAVGATRLGPLVAVNCSAIPESLLESELFGYEEGAFTGARRGGKAGKFELADGGTLFLDEVGDLPLGLQPKLLRALERKMIDRVGGTSSRALNIRVIAASNCNLAEQVRDGRFRADLFYRLKGFPLYIPPLRERRGDIVLLADAFLAEVDGCQGRMTRRWSDEAAAALTAYDWPGNVRELRNAVEYAATMAEDEVIGVDCLPAEMQGNGDHSGCVPDQVSIGGSLSLRDRVAAFERELLASALAAVGQNVEGKRQVAESMGVSLPTLYRRLKELGLSS